ncbi:amino acid transporter-like protein [Polychaeton citri CBS 116435]|uniref:Amino acid transporter-like protein n=1 Tax=Polychaeton citri CBS 116435 TaxID=1314669 RepID=A0A9P4UNR5_9PEZI|nr:amino acid transporter-like protein [Polychaeton citri CBS 116435]
MGKHSFQISEASPSEACYADECDVSPTIPEKFRGTRADTQDMVVLGKKQVLRRSFNFFTMLGFSSTVMTAWEILPIIAVFPLEDGGLPIIFWGAVAGAIGLGFVYASLAEVASMSPTAGGQYHWVSELAPPRFQKGISYSVGWLVGLGWQVYLASVCFMMGGVIEGLIALNNDNYVSKPWHTTLIAIAVVTFAILFNTFLAVRLPFLEGIVFVLHVAGLFAIIIPLWVTAPHGNARDTLFKFTNDGGWSSTGLSALIGMTSIVGTLIGYDCSVHMSEEVRDAAVTVPRTLLWSFLPNALMFITMGATFIFCVGDLENVMNTTTGQPFIQVFYNATQSHAGTTIMVTIMLIMLMSAAIGETATASRQLWSFARDKGFPGWTWLSHVSPGWNVPLRAVVVCFVVTSLLSLINLGSSEALNAITSLGVVSILFSYFITIGCLVLRRLYGEPLPPRPWSLGRWGLPINIMALIFVTPILFFCVWPLTVPVTAQNMNWSIVMFSGVLSVAAVYYIFWARHAYTGPVALVKRTY